MAEFYFREEELNKLQNFYSNEKQKSMAIFGRRRIGKSELILHFIRNLNNAYYYQVNSLDYDASLNDFKNVIKNNEIDSILDSLNNFKDVFSYISNNIKRKTQIWVDIGSNTWNMKIEKDLANPLVLKKSFRDEDIYTSDMEESYKKYFLYNTVYNLLKYAENVYAYKSDYSINGYIQEGGLYSLLLRLINKGGDALE